MTQTVTYFYHGVFYLTRDMTCDFRQENMRCGIDAMITGYWLVSLRIF